LPGMTADVALILGEAGSDISYLVPISAIAAGDAPGQGFVYVFDPQSSTVKKTEVRGRGVQDNRVFVTEGLAPGDVIAVAGVSFLRDGQKVKLMTQ
jgi:multidrug efflux pump subunit AcrA (membrane-fusion protein)